MLGGPRKALELAGMRRISHSQKRSSHFCSNSSVEEGLNSKCPGPMTLLYASRVFTFEKERKKERNDVCVLIIENYNFKILAHSTEYAHRAKVSRIALVNVVNTKSSCM